MGARVAAPPAEVTTHRKCTAVEYCIVQLQRHTLQAGSLLASSHLQKEIHEQPESIFQTMRGRVKMGPQVGACFKLQFAFRIAKAGGRCLQQLHAQLALPCTWVFPNAGNRAGPLQGAAHQALPRVPPSCTQLFATYVAGLPCRRLRSTRTSSSASLLYPTLHVMCAGIPCRRLRWTRTSSSASSWAGLRST